MKASGQWIVLSIILNALLSRHAWGQLHFTELKGLEANIQLKPEYEYLHPLHGFALAKQGFLTNLYNYPTIDEKNKITDPTEDFIHSVFNTAQGSDSPSFFQVSPLAEKCGRFLAPSTIGGILGILSQNDPKKADLKKLGDELKKVIEEDPGFQHRINPAQVAEEEYREALAQKEAHIQIQKELLTAEKEKKNKIASQKTKLKREREQCGPETDENRERINDLVTQMKELESKLATQDQEIAKIGEGIKSIQAELEKDPAYQRLRFQVQKETYKPEYLKKFIDRLLKSWASGGPENPRFPRHFTEQVLVALAIMNTKDHDKGALISLYQKLPQALAYGKVNYGPWLKESYSRKDYVDLKKKISGMKDLDERSQYLMKHPEELAFLSFGRSFFDGGALPEIGYKTVSYLHPKKGVVSFADCMDSSILNFLGIVLRDPKTSLLSAAPIQGELSKNALKIHPGFEEFIKSHPEINTLDSLDAHRAWVPLVQGLKDIHYVNGDYEMDTTLNNLFHVMDHLLFHPNGQLQTLFDLNF